MFHPDHWSSTCSNCGSEQGLVKIGAGFPHDSGLESVPTCSNLVTRDFTSWIGAGWRKFMENQCAILTRMTYV